MKIKKQIDFEIFDEDDWKFDSLPNTEYFGEDLSEFYKEPFYKTFIKRVSFILWWVISLMGVLFFAIVVCLKVSHSTDSNEDHLNNLTIVEQEDLTLDRIDGESVSSSELISISSIFSEYTYTLSTQKDFETLNNLCENSSVFSEVERKNREKSEYNLDEYDCTARAYRGIASKISLKRVNDVIYKDGIYYCYVDLSTPDTGDLFEYYLRYSYEMTQFLNVHGVSMTSVSEYVNQTIEYADYPVSSREYLFTVKQVGDTYVLTDDSQIATLCDTIFDVAVNQIVEISGSKLPKENMG